MTHCWILLAPSGQLVFRDFLGFEIFLRFLDVGDLALWLSLLLFLIPSRFSPCHLFYYNSFPVLVKSQVLIYITTNVFPTGSSPPVGDFQQKLLPPRTIQPHYGTTTQLLRTITLLQTNQTTRHPHSRTKHPTNNPTTLLTLPIRTHTTNYVEQYQTVQLSNQHQRHNYTIHRPVSDARCHCLWCREKFSCSRTVMRHVVTVPAFSPATRHERQSLVSPSLPLRPHPLS